MSRPLPKIRVPQYCRHAARNKGYVRIEGRVIYLPGAFGSVESRAAYDQYIAQWIGNGRRLPTTETPEAVASPSPAASAVVVNSSPLSPARSVTVGEIVLAYLKYAKVRYAEHGHFYSIAGAFKPLVRLFRHLPATEFGPKKFKEVRQALINRERKLRRREINNRMRWIRNGFKWAVEEEMIPGEVFHRLTAVGILRRNEAPVPESEQVRPVDEAVVLETIKHANREVAAMARIQMLTGARSGEVCGMRAIDIDMTKDVWLFRPSEHKTKSRGKERVIPMGRRAQEIVREFVIDDPQAYVFSPKRAGQRRRELAHQARVTPAGQGNNVGKNLRENPLCVPGERYTACSYGRAIRRAIQVAFPVPEHLTKVRVKPTGRKKKLRLETNEEWCARLTPEQRAEVKAWRMRHHWHPHQLRHTVATAVRDKFGLDFSQALLGHANLSATQIYAELNKAKAIEVVREIG